MLNYEQLSFNRGSIIRYKSFAASFPWCFKEAFIPSERRYGIAPIIGVRGEACIPFICAMIAGDHRPPNELLAKKLTQKEHLKQACVQSNTWLFDHLPLWLNEFQVPEHTTYQLAGQVCSAVDGSSAGLSALLSTLSQLLKLPLSSKWMYSATVSDQGSLGRVNSILEKAQGIQQFCPEVRHLLIGNYGEQTSEVISNIERIGLQVYTAGTVHEAFNIIPIGPYPSIQQAIEASMEQWISNDEETLLRFIDNAFLSALQGYSQIYGWGSLAAMFLRIKSHARIWPKLGTNHRCKCDAIIMIADRYLNGRNRLQGRQSPPPPIQFGAQHIKWLEDTSASNRLMLLPHLMQQLHERPDSIESHDSIIELAKSLLPNPREEWIAPLHLKLAGSWGRYLTATTKEYQSAYEWQTLCFRQWCQNGFYDQASYPMCALMELSEVLPEHEDTIHRLWIEFANKPNSKVSQIRRFIPQYWQEKLFGSNAR